jgi:hypothetical protein
MSLPGLKDDPERARHHRLQHVAFELKTVDDLLAIPAGEGDGSGGINVAWRI